MSKLGHLELGLRASASQKLSMLLLELYQGDTYVAAPYPYTEEPILLLHESEHK